MPPTEAGRQGPDAAAAGALRESNEFQSALVRFPLGIAALLYLFAADATGAATVRWFEVLLLYSLHLVAFIGLTAWVVARPAYKRGRADLSIGLDLSATTALIYLSGDPLSPLYLIYVVLFISHGSRYGPRNLMLTAIGGIGCFAGSVTFMGGWRTEPTTAVFILCALALLPLYQHRLLRNRPAARRRAEVANAARGDFLATMSHELRTPLSGVLGMARLLERTRLDDEQRRCVDSIASAGHTLQGLIGDVLDLSKVDAGGLELHGEDFQLRPSVLAVARNLMQQALEKEVEIVCCIDDTLPVSVHGDRVRFEQILYNLIGNAVKFTPAGRICIQVERSPAHPGLPGEVGAMEHLEIVIGDTGIGIPRERLDHIFESFWQADTSASREHGGTGLGTTIAHRLVAAMGGQISADSEERRGTTFWVRLPWLGGASEAPPPAPPPLLAGLTVLVFEFDPEGRTALERLCRQAGMRVLSCSDEAELARHLELASTPFAVDVAVIADTPAGMDLEAAMERLCARLNTSPPPVYATYSGRQQQVTTAAARGIGKPWQASEVWQALARALDPAGTDTTAPAGEAGPPAALASAMRILVVEDDRINAALVETLLQRAGYSAEVVHDGESALARVGQEAFDGVLVDLRMPRMDGFEFTRRLRAREVGGRRLPVVALTASVTGDARARGIRAGMDALLTKPVDPDALHAELERLAGVDAPA
jgi:two-component system sensor histidine kinase RpfC